MENLNGLTQLKNGMKNHEIVGFTLGLALFAVSMYAFHLSIKANKLSIKELNDKGYK